VLFCVSSVAAIVPPVDTGAAAAAMADLSMVVPTYNERDRIAELVAAVFAA